MIEEKVWGFMRKVVMLGMSLILLFMMVACNNNNDTSNNQVAINIENQENNKEDNDLSVVDTKTDENPDPIDETQDTDETLVDETETDEGEETETETGQAEETETETGESDTGETSEEIDQAEDADEALEAEVEIDYTANIKQPYDDVDYSPQNKTEGYESNPPVHAKALFITANTAASSKLDEIIALIDETELNALVIDVKNDDGNILFYSEAAEKYVPGANNGVQIKDMESFMAKLKEHNIYTIARVVAFKSPQFAKSYPEKGITYRNSGNLYYADGSYWASPYDQDLWDYNIAVSKEAVLHGFNEIQFDYVRFPATGSKLDKSLDFKNPEGHSKTYAIQEFVKKAYEEISPLEAYIALDVFGWTATTINDSGIGQHWEGMSNVTDYMSPMVYPSHYGPNNFGIPVPDARPYQTVYASMEDAIERNANIETPAKLRPWLQAFTAKWVDGYIPYGRNEIQGQIQACKDLGIDEYIFWSSSNNYPKHWFEGVE
jgi:hypothetical protein